MNLDGLRMASEVMLDLARKAAALVVERIESLPGETAWDGEFRQVLEARLEQDPPEERPEPQRSCTSRPDHRGASGLPAPDSLR